MSSVSSINLKNVKKVQDRRTNESFFRPVRGLAIRQGRKEDHPDGLGPHVQKVYIFIHYSSSRHDTPSKQKRHPLRFMCINFESTIYRQRVSRPFQFIFSTPSETQEKTEKSVSIRLAWFAWYLFVYYCHSSDRAGAKASLKIHFGLDVNRIIVLLCLHFHWICQYELVKRSEKWFIF
jgi:hypothetical protein